MIAVDRPLPDAFRALSEFFVTTATSLERREAELRRSEAFLAQAQRLTKTGSLWWKPATGEVIWSDENYRIMEYPVGTPPTVEMAMRRCHPDDMALVREQLEAAIEKGASVDFEHRLLMPNGAVKHVRVVFQNVAADDAEAEFLGAATDITDRKQAEERLHASEAYLAELRSELSRVAKVMSLGTLTASIAHEVNQPLSGVVTNASTCLRLLAADPPNLEGARETARRAIRDGLRASEVIARLRALFFRQRPPADPVDVNDATREVVELSRSELQRRAAVVRLDLANELPVVLGDRFQLQQVLINLLRNASEAMINVDERPREIAVSTRLDAEGRVLVSVRDGGVGFAFNEAEKLFDAFHTTKVDGMGIGLSVSRSIIERHGGRLWAVPNEGAGATFSFSIPVEPGGNNV